MNDEAEGGFWILDAGVIHSQHFYLRESPALRPKEKRIRITPLESGIRYPASRNHHSQFILLP
jgi:hypothetical protein